MVEGLEVLRVSKFHACVIINNINKNTGNLIRHIIQLDLVTLRKREEMWCKLGNYGG